MSEATTWTLWRQDDKGSSAVIARNLEKSVAASRRTDLEARGHKQHYWIEPEVCEVPTTLNLVVIRAEDIERSKAFFELLGLRFSRHQHGNGSEHYACEFPTFVFEIYPRFEESSVGTRIGFSVPSVETAVRAIREAGYAVIRQPKDSPWGRRAVVRDPDGHRVELTTPVGTERVTGD